MTDHTKVVYIESEIEMSWPIAPSTIYDDSIGVVYVEIETKLLGPILLVAVCDENQTTQWRDWLYRCCLWWKWNWTIKRIEPCIVCYENQKEQSHDR